MSLDSAVRLTLLEALSAAADEITRELVPGSVHVRMLFVTTLAVARIWPSVFSNAVDPGWVPNRMGGPGAPDDLRLG